MKPSDLFREIMPPFGPHGSEPIRFGSKADIVDINPSTRKVEKSYRLQPLSVRNVFRIENLSQLNPVVVLNRNSNYHMNGYPLLLLQLEKLVLSTIQNPKLHVTSPKNPSTCLHLQTTSANCLITKQIRSYIGT